MDQKPPEKYDWESQVGAQKFILRPRNQKLAVLAGYLVSQFVGFGSLALVTAIFHLHQF